MDTLAAVAANSAADHSAVGNAAFIDECIAETLPKFQGKRHDEIFHFARLLKRRFPSSSPEEFRAAVMTWHAKAVERLGADKIRADAIENWGDFLVLLSRLFPRMELSTW